MVYLAVFVVIFGLLISFIIWIYSTSARIKTLKELQTNCQSAMEAIIYEIRTAESIYSPTTASSQLSLYTFSGLPLGETFTYTDIFLCGERICLKKESVSPIALTKKEVKASGLQFEQITGASGFASVRISFLLEAGEAASPAQLTCSGSASLRNY